MDGHELAYFLTAVIPAGLLIVMMILGDIEFDFGLDLGIGDIHLFSDAGPLGVKAILAFVSGFGLGGLIAENQDWSIGSILSGFLFAIGLYLIVLAFMRFVYSQRSNSLKTGNLVGQAATVTTQIPKGKPGEITTIDPDTGSAVNLIARSVKSSSPGTQVTIVQVRGGTAYVE